MRFFQLPLSGSLNLEERKLSVNTTFNSLSRDHRIVKASVGERSMPILSTPSLGIT